MTVISGAGVRAYLTDVRGLLLAVALLGLSAGMPKVTLPRATCDYVVVFDITQSMNVQDMVVGGRSVSRLDFAREAMRRALRTLPCGSRIGWGVFTEYRTLLTLAPIEVCANYGDLLATLNRIDGRIRWADSSEISKGVFWALRALKELGGDDGLVFITDGQEAPPLRQDQMALFDDIRRGQAHGFLAGVGGAVPMPIPRTDVNGRPIGFWHADDVVQRVGISAAGVLLHEHLSELREPHLQDLSRQVGLDYLPLHPVPDAGSSVAPVDALALALQDARFTRRLPVPTDLSWLPLGLAFGLLLWHFRPLGLWERWRAGRRRTRGALAATALVGLSTGAQGAPVELHVQSIAPGVYVDIGDIAVWGSGHRGHMSNSGFVIGTRCIAMIDSGGSPSVGRALRAAVRRVSALPVCFVINTHDHPDHVMGNSALVDANVGVTAVPPGAGPAERPRFVGHAKLAAAIGAREAFFLKAMARDFDPEDRASTITPPDVAVADTLTLDLGGRTLRLDAWPTAHTDNDLTVLDDASGTLFLGDLAFVEHLPVVDGSLLGWIDVLHQLQTLPAAWGISQAVPGHGPVIHDWPAGLQPTLHYLTRLQADVQAALRRHWSLAQTVDRLGADTPEVLPQPLPGQPAWQLVADYHRRNLTAAYAELEWAQ
jgi:quinoprotein relay system zinc metallohydrolase 2